MSAHAYFKKSSFGRDTYLPPKQAKYEDISPEEIERRFQSALWRIKERSRRRRLEMAELSIGRQQSTGI